MSTRGCALALLYVAAVLACMAHADDVIIPPWRGMPGSTVQEWDFTTDANPALPENYANPYGTPSATISLGFAASGYWETYPPIPGGRVGVWDIGRGIDEEDPAIGRITLVIPNTVNTDPTSYKEIWVQVTYYKDLTMAPIVEVPGGVLLGGESRRIEIVPMWGEWWLDQTMWRIEPNPTQETILITGHDWGSMIDQVVVDTICIPEPATMSLVGVGCVLLFARRRRAD